MSRTDPHLPGPEGTRHERSRAAGSHLRCRDVIVLPAGYLEATLHEDSVALFERHPADCAPCRASLRTYDRSRQLIGQVEHVDMPVEMRDRLRDLLLGRLDSRSS